MHTAESYIETQIGSFPFVWNSSSERRGGFATSYSSYSVTTEILGSAQFHNPDRLSTFGADCCLNNFHNSM